MQIVYKVFGGDCFPVEKGRPFVFVETESESKEECCREPILVIPENALFTYDEAEDGWIDAVVRASELTFENVRTILAHVNDCSIDQIQIAEFV